MKILTAQQIHAWDEFTIQHEPVASIDLMERAALQCVEWLITNNFSEHHFKIFCGKGNNGGDGLAIARMLMQRDMPVTILDTDTFQLVSHFDKKTGLEVKDASVNTVPVS